MTKKFFIKTYGCQMNDLDSLQMERLLKKSGYLPSIDPEEADVILVNTCTIREKAAQKVYSDIGRFRSIKMRRPEIVLGVTGCQAQAEGIDLQRRFPYLDLVVGPDHVEKIPDLVEELFSNPGKRSLEINFAGKENYRFLNLMPDEEENAVKSFLTIMKGCDNFCSYCVVPFVRGREVSRPHEEIIEEVRQLTQYGVREVTLLGQNVNSYGNGGDPSSKEGREESISFPTLLRRIAEETEIQRIRFTTSHPKDLPDELIEEFRFNKKLGKSLHLPVQSGSDAVLERMYRGYTRESYLERLNRFRVIDEEIAFSTDIIVGFPGESEVDFEATMDLLREVRYDLIYSFVYSERPNTAAAINFEDDIPLEVKQGRLKRLQELQSQISYEKNRASIGKEYEVLVEGPSKQGKSYCGRSSQNHMVHFEGSENDVGKILPIKIVHAGPHSLMGEKND